MPNTYQSGAVQTTATADPAIGIPGLEVDNGLNDKVTRIAVGAVPFGSYVAISGETCFVPALSTDITVRDGGVAVLDPQKVSGQGYLDGEPVTVLRSGRIYMIGEGVLTELDNPFIRYVVNGALNPGSIAHAVDAAKNVQAVNGIQVVKTTSGAGVVQVQLDYPGANA